MQNYGETTSSRLDEPAKFLYSMGCYTRFSDGETDKQWIPEQFVEDCGAG
jgi:hypothetical protein